MAVFFSPKLSATKTLDEGKTPMVLLQVNDESGQGWLALNNDLVVDTVPPYVLNVESSKRNGKGFVFFPLGFYSSFWGRFFLNKIIKTPLLR